MITTLITQAAALEACLTDAAFDARVNGQPEKAHRLGDAARRAKKRLRRRQHSYDNLLIAEASQTAIKMTPAGRARFAKILEAYNGAFESEAK